MYFISLLEIIYDLLKAAAAKVGVVATSFMRRLKISDQKKNRPILLIKAYSDKYLLFTQPMLLGFALKLSLLLVLVNFNTYY